MAVTLLFTDIGKSCPVHKMCPNAFRENKVLAKISEFTVLADDTSKQKVKIDMVYAFSER